MHVRSHIIYVAAIVDTNLSAVTVTYGGIYKMHIEFELTILDGRQLEILGIVILVRLRT